MKPILKILAVSTLAMAAFGADNKLNFHVEFPFNVGKITMPAGEYSIMETGVVRPHFQLMNVAAKKSAFLMLPPFNVAKTNDVKASIVFRCGDAGCEIANVRNLRSGYVYHAWSAKKPILRMITVALSAPEKTAE